MAFYFGTGTQSVTLADHAALDLPNGEWAIAFRAQETSRATSSRLVYRSNFPTTANSIEITMGSGAFANEFYVNIVDASDSTLSFPITANPFNAGTPVDFILQRESDGFVRLYFNAALAGTSNAQLTTAINTSAALWLGNRSDSARPFNGWIAEYTQRNRAFTPDERAAHYAGFSPPFFPGRAVYVPAIRDYVELQAGIAVTNNGSTVVAHPPIIYLSGPYTIQAPVTAGETHEFEGSQTVSFDGTAALKQSAAFTGDATVNMDGTADTVLNEWRMTGAETVSFDGTADTIRNHWLMTGAEEVSFDGSAALKQSAALAGGETVSFDGEAALDIASITFEGQGLLSFDGSIATVNAILKMQAAQSISFDGQAQLGQEAIFEGGASLSFDGLANLTAFEWDAVDAATTPTWQDVD